MPTIDLNALPEAFRHIPDPLARLAAAWQMVPADDPDQIRMALPMPHVQAMRQPDAELLLVGAREDAPHHPAEIVQAIVQSEGVVGRGVPQQEQTGRYGIFVLRVTRQAVGVYEYPSTNAALEAAHGAGRTTARRRQDGAG